jgi:hypothetical protein
VHHKAQALVAVGVFERVQLLALPYQSGCLAPPGLPHGAINRGPAPVMVVNALLRHWPSDGRDYKQDPFQSA